MRTFSNAIVPFLAALALFHAASAFTPASRTLATGSRCNLSVIKLADGAGVVRRNSIQLYSTPDDGEENVTSSETVERAVVTPEEPAAPYPINVPSPILLASSMVLAIASTGSIFELFGDSPKVGFGPAVAIVVIGLPTSLFLFYAAILKGTAETEEDDKEYNKPRGRF